MSLLGQVSTRKILATRHQSWVADAMGAREDIFRGGGQSSSSFLPSFSRGLDRYCPRLASERPTLYVR